MPNDVAEYGSFLAALGRGNDSMLAHITPREAAILRAFGGSGTRNPHTGLMEFDDGGGGYDNYMAQQQDTQTTPNLTGALLPGYSIAPDGNVVNAGGTPVAPWVGVDQGTPGGVDYYRQLEYGNDAPQSMAPVAPQQFFGIYNALNNLQGRSNLGGGAQIPFGVDGSQFNATAGNPNYSIDPSSGYATLTPQGQTNLTQYEHEQTAQLEANKAKNASGPSGYLGTPLGGLSVLALPLAAGGLGLALGAGAAFSGAEVGSGIAGLTSDLAGGVGAGAGAVGAGGIGNEGLFLGGTATEDAIGSEGIGIYGAGMTPATAEGGGAAAVGDGFALGLQPGEALGVAGTGGGALDWLGNAGSGALDWIGNNPLKAAGLAATAGGALASVVGGNSANPQQQNILNAQGLTTALQGQSLAQQVLAGGNPLPGVANLQNMSTALNADAQHTQQQIASGQLPLPGAPELQQQVAGLTQSAQALRDQIAAGHVPIPGADQLQAQVDALTQQAQALQQQVASGHLQLEGAPQLLAQANMLAVQAETMRSYLMTGTLPPGLQAGVDQAAKSAKAALSSLYASHGMSNSSAAKQDMANIDTNKAAQMGNLAISLFGQGLSEAQVANAVYQSLVSSSTNLLNIATTQEGMAMQGQQGIISAAQAMLNFTNQQTSLAMQGNQALMQGSQSLLGYTQNQQSLALQAQESVNSSATQLLSLAFNATGLSAGINQQLLNLQLQEDQQLQTSLAAFARALSGQPNQIVIGSGGSGGIGVA